MIITEQMERDLLNLHIHLGKLDYADVSDLIRMRETRYLFTMYRLYL